MTKIENKVINVGKHSPSKSKTDFIAIVKLTPGESVKILRGGCFQVTYQDNNSE